MATLTIPDAIPSSQEDCEQLHKAFEGWGTNEKLIVSVLAHHDATQRRAIRVLIRRPMARISLKLFFMRLMEILRERDALLANESATKWSPANHVLVEIACARSSEELFAVRRAYHDRYKHSLEEDVAAHTTGDFRKLLVPLVSSFRYEGEDVNMNLAKSEAKLLHEKIPDKNYSDEEVIRVLTTRSKPQIMATLNHYHNEHGNPINKDLKSDPKDEFLAALRAVIRCISCPEKYMEKVIRLAINRHGTDEHALTRIVTTRAEVDLKAIKEVYQTRNSTPLDKAIKHETWGHYERMLLALLGCDEA